MAEDKGFMAGATRAVDKAIDFGMELRRKRRERAEQRKADRKRKAQERKPAEKADPRSVPLGGIAGIGKQTIGGRHHQIDDEERKALGGD